MPSTRPPSARCRAFHAALSVLLLGACSRHPAAAGPAATGGVDVARAAAEAAPVAPALPLVIAPDLTVRAVRFGLLKSDSGTDDDFVATDEIPAVDGQAFGWIVEVTTTRRSLHWQEHLRMPAPPVDWGDAASDPDIEISKDGKSVLAQGEDDVEDGELSRFYWSLATGDPAGDYQLDVAVEGHAVAHIRFHVDGPVREQTFLVRHLHRAGPPVQFQNAAARLVGHDRRHGRGLAAWN